jgi:hypothetical protein
MTIGTERTTTTASQTRETPNLFRAPEKDVDRDPTHDPVSSQIHALMSASGATGSSLQAATIFRSPEFSQPVNDLQKARVLRSLQRSHGNQSVQRMMNRSVPAGIQPKLEISSPGDALEREADSIANQVMNMSSPNSAAPAQLSRHPLPISRAPEGAASRTASPEFERSLNAQGGNGQPLSRSSREFFEPRMGHDLSGVRVHHGGEAAAAAQEINAQAFTHGRDIYFNEGKYQPETTSGRRLLAHELAHTVQQSGGTQRSTLQRTSNLIQRTDGTTPSSSGYRLQGGNPPQVYVPTLEIPEFKREGAIAAAQGGFYRAASYTRTDAEGNDPAQRTKWKSEFAGNADWVSAPCGPLEGLEHPHMHAVAHGGHFDAYSVVGALSRKPTREALTIPFWDREGHQERFEVDHISELQMSGWPRDTWANSNPANFQLLSAEANRSSGTTVRNKIKEAIEHALDELPTLKSNAQAAGAAQKNAQVEWVKAHYDVNFANLRGVSALNPPGLKRWTLNQIKEGQHLSLFRRVGRSSRSIKMYNLQNANPVDDRLSPLPEGERLEQMIGSEAYMKVFLRSYGGVSFGFPFPANSPISRATTRRDPIVHGLVFDQVAFYRGGTSPLRGRLWASLDPGLDRFVRLTEAGGSSRQNMQSIDVVPFDGLDFAGRVNFDPLYSLRRIYVGGMSPVDISSVDIDRDGLQIRGRIRPTIPLIANAAIDLVVSGNDLRVEKTFDAGEIQVPRPFSINTCSMTVSLGTRSGLRAEGQLGFEIQRVGRGFLDARVGTADGLLITGGFDFDSSTFDPARIRLRYENGNLSGEGTIGIGSGKIRGIRTATIRATYADGRLEAHGTAEFTVPGLQQGTLDLVYSEAEGLTLGGTLTLGSIPGIRSGSVAAQVRKPAGADTWQLSARGTAVPAIPGVDSSLTVSYDDGIFTAEARASYRRGMLSGTIEVGATNRPINPEGRPVEGGEPGRTITPYGQGQLTVRIAPWLQGTAGVRILPNGEIEVSGAIGLPASLNIFPAKPFNKNIFHIDLDIPIVGVTVLRQRIGIFATIGGGLDVDAGIGPGQLRELGLGITYNPAHEDQTHVTGRAQLFIPAHAGLRLFVRGGLGVGIPIVSATARLVVGASLGLEGAVVASVEVDWMPQRGLILNAQGEIYAQPKFRFDVTGEVLVEADLLLTTVELYKKTWNLASFEWGSDLRFGIRFPIHYEEGREFDISLNDVEFVVPQINPLDLLTGLVRRIG